MASRFAGSTLKKCVSYNDLSSLTSSLPLSRETLVDLSNRKSWPQPVLSQDTKGHHEVQDNVLQDESLEVENDYFSVSDDEYDTEYSYSETESCADDDDSVDKSFYFVEHQHQIYQPEFYYTAKHYETYTIYEEDEDEIEQEENQTDSITKIIDDNGSSGQIFDEVDSRAFTSSFGNDNVNEDGDDQDIFYDSFESFDDEVFQDALEKL